MTDPICSCGRCVACMVRLLREMSKAYQGPCTCIDGKPGKCLHYRIAVAIVDR